MPRVVISGASGLVGSALIPHLRSVGYEVSQLVRGPARSDDELCWSPGERRLDPEVLAGADAIISLNGASVGRLPWTRSYRRKLVQSRVDPTRTIAEALRDLGADAPHFISASAVGYYGSAPGLELDESALPGDSYLAKVCIAWEAAAREVEDLTTVSLLRTAPILDPDGVLKPMIWLTKLGLAGPLAGGEQHWPWISLTDEIRAITHVLRHRISGPVNLTGPQPARANDIGRALAQHLDRPFWMPAPTFGLNLLLSKAAAESLLTSDAKVNPGVLNQTGFRFQHPTVTSAIAASM